MGLGLSMVPLVALSAHLLCTDTIVFALISGPAVAAITLAASASVGTSCGELLEEIAENKLNHNKSAC